MTRFTLAGWSAPAAMVPALVAGSVAGGAPEPPAARPGVIDSAARHARRGRCRGPRRCRGFGAPDLQKFRRR